MRLAWFTPLPPARTGIAAYNAELLPLLAASPDSRSQPCSIDVFVAAKASAPSIELGLPVFPSRDFAWRNVRRPYDLVVYQLGNSQAHDYMWPYIVRFPGLLVLHDAQLHHSRALSLLTAGRQADYRAELAFCHPDARPGIADAVISATAGSLFYMWPLVRVPIDCARMVAVHTPGLAALLEHEHPRQQFTSIRMGVADPGNPGSEAARTAAERVRRRHGLADEAVLFAAFGMATPEKRLPEILRALRGVLPAVPSARLMIVGDTVGHYDVMADARAVGVAEQLTLIGYVGDEALPEYLQAADVCLSLRWPSSRETSAAWLRCLAAGKPTVITDLVHTTDVPALDPRSWQPLPTTAALWNDTTKSAHDVRTSERPNVRAPEPGEAICVAIDILDEQHSLGIAMRRLAADAALRRDLGRRARQFWEERHTPAHMAADYQHAIAAACLRPPPDRSHLPAHLRHDAFTHVRDLLSALDIDEDRLHWNGQEKVEGFGL